MKIVVLIIMMSVGLGFLLRLTALPRIGRWIMAVMVGATALLGYDFAASQSKTMIADWLQNPELMLDVAVLLTIDVAVQMAFCFVDERSRWGRLLKWFPGLLIFPIVLTMLTYAIFAMPGVDFAVVGIVTGVGIMTLLPVVAWGLLQLMPEAEIRMELLFLTGLLTAALGVVATVNGRTAAVGVGNLNWEPLAALIGMMACGLVMGIIVNKIAVKRKLKKII